MTRLRELSITLIVVAVFCSASRAGTVIVDPSGAGDFTAIQPAIDAAQPSDTILVKAGEYVITEPISFKGKAITVKSESGAEATTIRMAEFPADPNRASVSIFESGEAKVSVLEGFKITGGKGTKYGT